MPLGYIYSCQPTQGQDMSSTNIVLWTARNNLRLRVLGEAIGRNGEARFAVCKEECPNPAGGQFSVRVEDVVPA